MARAASAGAARRPAPPVSSRKRSSSRAAICSTRQHLHRAPRPARWPAGCRRAAGRSRATAGGVLRGELEIAARRRARDRRTAAPPRTAASRLDRRLCVGQRERRRRARRVSPAIPAPPGWWRGAHARHAAQELSTSSAHASIRCSQLSRMSSSRLRSQVVDECVRHGRPDSSTPSVVQLAAQIAGRPAAQARSAIRRGEAPATVAATCSASRVLPAPPAPLA